MSSKPSTRQRALRRVAQLGLILSVVAVGYFVKNGGYLSPGPLSAAQSTGRPIGGYNSHAAFEQECRHCHGPVHCVTADGCQNCHREIAAERMDAVGLHGILPGVDRCAACHSEHQGRDVTVTVLSLTNIDHDQLTGFALDRHQFGYDGAPLACADCHSDGRYGPDAVDCVTCHAAAAPQWTADHAALFGTPCQGCHDGRDRYSAFDHDATFARTGAHSEAACTACHADNRFEAQPRRCVDCHEPAAHHADQFGRNCHRCHSAESWQPALLREHTFDRRHGQAEPVACATCHVARYTTYTCYGCHDHTPGDTAFVHQAAGVLDFAACADCHLTGQPDDWHAMPTAADGDVRQRVTRRGSP